uniref:ADAM metallopeptidase with thrombospondin type 1 motif 7 n=1 Tax=Echeneis naucrates TaxID=173247 RepID=A0A665UVS2_ECHNA
FLSHQARRVQRRSASAGRMDLDRVFYQLWHSGHNLNFNLTLNPNLLAPGFLTERRYGGLDGAKIHPPGSFQCHFLGEVWDGATLKGNAAMSTCDGLTGLFRFSDEEFFIQPLEKSNAETSAPQAHAIYKRHVSRPSWDSHLSLVDVERQRERWEHHQRRRRRRIRQRSVSKEKWVETLVVADHKMVEYHGTKAVEGYVLAVMNIVAGLFRDATIGNAINIVVIRLILLEQEESDLKITHHADNSLNSFCKWQKKLNMKGDEHPLHHDVAVLLTRKDICAAINMPCETLGLSHVAGICQPHRSCSISEDTGLPLAFTVAHELGHNFGIQHDGNGNDCEPIGKRPFVMSPQLLYGTSLPSWSRCSRQYITRFLDRGWGWCLDDAPAKDKLSLNLVLPGVLYSATHQCRLQYGPGSLLCDDMDNVCSTLWCTVGTTCHSKLDGAVDGTSCGENKWCFSGECVTSGFLPESVNGGWASWSEWSACSRTCGAGVRSAQRDCDNPVPKNRGKYCLGERRRYKVCNINPCPSDMPTFRNSQCSHFNNTPYKGKLHKWEAVINKVNPCELHCRPLNEHFSEKMRDAVIDGTPCLEGNKSRDMCINGICKSIGCDYVIDSSAVEDRCGVCHGNGSTCKTVKRTFEESEGLGYVDIGLIPEGARGIHIEEVAEAGNFLALRSDNPDEYFLNGGWTIQWNGEYKAAGTVFTYVRTGQLENLTSPGPTMEPLWVQLLFQETNPGVRYEYTISQNISEDYTSLFFWKYGSWSECSVTCGTGVQRQIVYCVERTTGIVEEHFCDPLTRPDDNQTSCYKDLCPAMWWVGEWQKCSASCGSSGLANRTVLCIQAVSAEEQEALQPTDCAHMPKPESLASCNTHIPCPADWTTGSWSECSLTCGNGIRRRNVTCSRNTGAQCDPLKKPLAVSACYISDCPQVVDNFGSMDWSGSGWPSKEVLNEINSIPEGKPLPKVSNTRAQPRNHKGDFHYHNNIENINQNSVEVDDFYYDYNFINFHEDLSDDFESESMDSEISFGLDAPQEDNVSHREKENTITETTSDPTVSSTISNNPVYVLNTEEPESTDIVKVNNSEITAAEDLNDTKTPSTQETDRSDYYEYNYIENPTLGPDDSADQEDEESPEPLGSPTPETVTEVQLDINLSKIPQTTNLNTVYSTCEDSSRDTDVELSTVPYSQRSPPLHIPLLLNSGNREASSDFTSSTGSEIIPPTIPEGASQPTPTDFLPAQRRQILPKLASTETSRTDSTSQAPPFDFDYNEIVVPPVARISKDNDPSPSHQLPKDLRDSPEPAATLYIHTSATTPVTPAAHWVTSNWSACSTSCGLGAIWRSLACSTGSDSDCDLAKRPAPAQRCYLRPCSTWKVGEWSKCSKNCEGGIQSRELQCFDMRDQRPLRPFHCRAMSSRPQTQKPCNLQPCLKWYTSSWGQCSEICGGGEQQRIVTCPEEDECDRDLQPSNIQSCNSQPCAQWLTGSWSQCSASCGGGVQHRLIKCINTKVDTDEEVDQAQCNHEPQPDSTQKCSVQECESAPTGELLGKYTI